MQIQGCFLAEVFEFGMQKDYRENWLQRFELSILIFGLCPCVY